jgi:hypothetical protein
LVLWPAFFSSPRSVWKISEPQRSASAKLARPRQDHEFLEVDRVVGMHAAIDDVHHRHRQRPRRGAADIAIERHVEGFGRCLGAGQRDAEDGVGAQPALVRGAVEIDHDLVDLHLFLDGLIAQRLEDFAVDGLDRLLHALAEITLLVAVAQLDRLMGTGGGARRHRRAADRAIFQHHIDFNGGIAPAIENFAANDVDDGGHVLNFPGKWRVRFGGVLHGAQANVNA